MATAKAKVYAASLDECRRKDLFLSKFPTDAKGLVSVHGEPAVGQDWKELLRKFNKHCSGREGELNPSSSNVGRLSRLASGWRTLRRMRGMTWELRRSQRGVAVSESISLRISLNSPETIILRVCCPSTGCWSS